MDKKGRSYVSGSFLHTSTEKKTIKLVNNSLSIVYDNKRDKKQIFHEILRVDKNYIKKKIVHLFILKALTGCLLNT